MKINMKNILLVFALTILLPLFASAQGNAFNFQGRLNDGTNPANGAYDLQFQLYDAITGGAQIGSTILRPNTVLINGVFSTTLDFGATAFNSPNAVFIEIGVKAAGSPNAFTILGPRQQLTVVPYAVRSNDSARLGGIAASDYVTNVSNSFIKNSTTAQTGDFNILGDGLVGRRLGVGFGSFTGTGITFDVIGNSRFRSSSGGSVDIGTPNGETGVSIIRGQGRSDLRFDGAIMRLVAGSGSVPPAETNGISISTQGNVGVGSTAPLDTKLYVNGKLTVDGSVTQPTWRRGLPKAMIRVSGGPSTPPIINDCYNGVTGETYVSFPLSTCGFQVRGSAGNNLAIITFPFSLEEPGAFFSFLNRFGNAPPSFFIENNGRDLRVAGEMSFDLLVF